MKKFFTILMVISFVFASRECFALGFFKKIGKDVEKGTKKIVKETKKAPKAVLRETKKVASTVATEAQKGIQAITEKTITGAVGPKGIEFVPNIKLSNERAIVQTFAPLVKLSSGEKYFPSSIEWYLQRVALKGPDRKVIVPMGKVTPADLEKYSLLKGIGKNFDKEFIINEQVSICDPKVLEKVENKYYLDPEGNEKTYRGQSPIDKEVIVPCYIDYKYNERQQRAIMRVFFFYPFNEPTPILQQGKILEALDIATAGSHEGDIERVDIHLKQINNGVEISKIFFDRHCLHGKFEKFGRDGTHPIVYVAKYGHGSYGHTIPIVNALGDIANGKGVQWQCWKHYEIMNDQPWLEFEGKIGTDRKQNPRSKGFTPAVPGFKKRLLK